MKVEFVHCCSQNEHKYSEKRYNSAIKVMRILNFNNYNVNLKIILTNYFVVIKKVFNFAISFFIGLDF